MTCHTQTTGHKKTAGNEQDGLSESYEEDIRHKIK
jgi:hypothetical protein